jgi:hypothetical protein
MFIDKFNKTKKFVETTLTERISESISNGIEDLVYNIEDDIHAYLVIKKQIEIKLIFTHLHEKTVDINIIGGAYDEKLQVNINTSGAEDDIIIDLYNIIPIIIDKNLIDGVIMNIFSGANICRLNHEEFYKDDNKDDRKFCVKYLIGTPETSLADALFTNLTPKIN